jgi:predicted metal-dependent peptidase|tara:strand:+ start:13 stop:1332 length:1320 start_codon:yes stop_codon:yes gene_type:complete
MDTLEVKAPKISGTPSDTAHKALGNIPESTKTNKEIEDRLIAARISMLLHCPFYGNLACRMDMRDATEWCPTAATDGKYFYYNRNFVDALSNEELVFLWGHEVEHCVYDHFGRRGDKNPMLWNIANDYVVNMDLVEGSVGAKIRLVDICFDYKYRNWTSEEVYDDLFKQYEEEGRIIDVSTLDVHLDMADGDDDGSGDKRASPGSDRGAGPAKYTAEEKRQIKEQFKNATMQAAKAAGNEKLPAGIKRLVNELVNPQLSWRELLPQQIQSVIRSDYSYTTPSRKGADSGFYLPGMERDQTIDIAVGMDTSGSMSDEMATDILSEVKGCMDQYNDFRIHLFCFDTEVHNPQVFTEHNMDEFMEYEPGGGGGTEFDCCWNYFKEEGIVPKKFIMFTDGYPWSSWGDETYCDTLFIVHGGGHGGHTPEAPFGITVPYERESK